MAVQLVHENPEMRNDPHVKRHFDWAEAQWEGRKRADRIYASFSRSLKCLLDAGLIWSRYRVTATKKRVRWFRSRYRLTDEGRRYLLSS